MTHLYPSAWRHLSKIRPQPHVTPRAQLQRALAFPQRKGRRLGPVGRQRSWHRRCRGLLLLLLLLLLQAICLHRPAADNQGKPSSAPGSKLVHTRVRGCMSQPLASQALFTHIMHAYSLHAHSPHFHVRVVHTCTHARTRPTLTYTSCMHACTLHTLTRPTSVCAPRVHARTHPAFMCSMADVDGTMVGVNPPVACDPPSPCPCPCMAPPY